MNQLFLQLYHASPYFLKVMAASAKGYYSRRWRYGPETEGFIQEALERESWSEEGWQAWREERLARLLHRAATQVPYYQEYWTNRRRHGDTLSFENLENWPILEKEPLRENPKAFVADDCDLKRMQCLHTSGTSGKPLTFWWDRSTARRWYALFEARWRHWHGVSRHDHWAILGGQLVSHTKRRRPPFWVWNSALNQLYMSSYHLAPDLIPHYLDALSRHRVRYLWGYPSSLYALALEVLRLKRRDVPMSLAVGYAEPLFPHQRQVIADAFQCPVRETYGMVEIVAAAGECPAGSLHLWPEVGVVEVVEGQEPAPLGSGGDLVCTGLLNADMLLIRYRVGDRGILPNSEITCSCGRTLPLLASVEGRVDDVLYTIDGRRIGRLSPVFKGDFSIREAQVIQDSLTSVRVRFVPAPGFASDNGYAIIEQLRARLGDIEVALERVDEIPRGANGKFRAVICNLPSEVKGKLQQRAL